MEARGSVGCTDRLFGGASSKSPSGDSVGNEAEDLRARLTLPPGMERLELPVGREFES